MAVVDVRARTLLALLLCAACAASSAPPKPDAGSARGMHAGAGHAATGQASSSGDAAGVAASSDAGGGAQPSDDLEAARPALLRLRYDDAAPPVDASNKFANDAAAQRFGQKLFFDPALSGPLIEGDNDGSAATLGHMGEPGKVSCSGCHLPASGFVDTRSPHQQISLASGWTARRTPSLLEAGFAPLYNWDGRRDSIWSQAIGVMESHAEFNSGRLFVALQIWRLHRADYEAIFGTLPALDDAARFPQLTPAQAGCVERATKSGAVYDCRGKPGDGADYDALSVDDQRAVTTVTVNTAKAIEAYVRRLRCGASRFDQWLDGDAAALDDIEQHGAALFVGRAHCDSCHSGPNLTDGRFHNVGLAPAQVAVAFVDKDDHGAATGVAALLDDPLNTRGAFSDGDRGVLPATLDAALEGAFRTPSLRCVSRRPSLMHTGQIRTLAQAVSFHDRGGDPAGNYPGQNELMPLALGEQDRADLTAFLTTLDGPGPDAALLAAP
jgi:cytochrome c peroxidase